MSTGLSSLPTRLARALKHPAVQVDAAACPLGLHLAWEAGSGLAAGQITLWPGESGAAQLICRAQPEVWNQVLSAVPPVGYQSFGALRRRPDVFRVEGAELSWVQALPFLERLLEALREEGRATPAAAIHSAANDNPAHRHEPPAHLRALSHIQGGYVQLGAQPNTWVYSEACGAHRLRRCSCCTLPGLTHASGMDSWPNQTCGVTGICWVLTCQAMVDPHCLRTNPTGPGV